MSKILHFCITVLCGNLWHLKSLYSLRENSFVLLILTLTFTKQVYLGLYSLLMRDFKTASAQFLDTVATFTSYELMDYETFVVYTIFCTVVALTRTDVKEKVTRNAEILEVLHGLPQIKNYLFSLYECRYADFFKSLAYVEQFMKMDRYFEKHYTFYVREMRIIAYNQLLESYSSLTLTYMANSFGVSTQFVDK